MSKAQKVRDLMKFCLFREGEVDAHDKAIIGDGIVRKFGFHPARLADSKEEIRQILREMDPTFLASGGGGWTFLNMAFDKNGEHWAEQPTCADLCALGTAAGFITFPLPREMWSALPGGVPYLVIDV